MEIGVISFGSLERDADGRQGSSAAAQRHLVEAITLAEEVGLDYFGLGQHHRRSMPVSQPAIVLAAAAQATSHIRLGSAITILGAEDAVRVFEQFATLDGLSNGRVDITVGKGAFLEPFHLYGVDLRDYDALFAEKLELLVQLTQSGPVISWEGKFRPPLKDAEIQPRPEQDWLPVWLGTGGKPGSIMRAAKHHLPIMFSDIGGDPAGFERLGALYREASSRFGSPAERAKVGIAGIGYVDVDGAKARREWREHFNNRITELQGRPVDSGVDSLYARQTRAGGSFFVGSPEEIADRIIALHQMLGQDRQIFESDWGTLPYRDSLRNIELLGTRVKPLVDEALGHVAPRSSTLADEDTVAAR